MAHLILVGLPGSGKTTVGRAVAARLGRPFLDFDEEIVRREGKSVAEIFAQRGEPAFREMERALTEELKSKGGMVLSPGGGWIMNPGVVDLVRPPARLVYLKVRPETALRRLGASRTARPLLDRPDPLAELSGLLAKRAGSYEKADIVVDAELLDTQQVIQQVVAVGTGS